MSLATPVREEGDGEGELMGLGEAVGVMPRNGHIIRRDGEEEPNLDGRLSLEQVLAVSKSSSPSFLRDGSESALSYERSRFTDGICTLEGSAFWKLPREG